MLIVSKWEVSDKARCKYTSSIVSQRIHYGNVICNICHLLCNSFAPVFFVGGRISYLRYLCLYAYSGVQHMLCCVFLLFVGGRMSNLRYLFLFANSGVLHILCCVFVLFIFVLFLVYSKLAVSLDCPLLIAPSVFSNVYVSFFI